LLPPLFEATNRGEGEKTMDSPWLRTITIVVVLLSVGSVEAMGQSAAGKRSRSDAVPREPLRPFSEIEHMLLKGALIAASIPAAWFILVLIAGALRDRWQAKDREAQPRGSEVDRSSPDP
jgi:hypothetical protein